MDHSSKNLTEDLCVSGSDQIQKPKRKLRRVASVPKPKVFAARSHIHRVSSIQNTRFDEARTFGERLAVCRVLQNLTQEQVAQETLIMTKKDPVPRPMKRTAYCMYEAENVEPKATTIAALAAALDVSCSWLAFGIGTPWDHNLDRQLVFDVSDQVQNNWISPDKLLAALRAKRPN